MSNNKRKMITHSSPFLCISKINNNNNTKTTVKTLKGVKKEKISKLNYKSSSLSFKYSIFTPRIPTPSMKVYITPGIA